MKYRKISFLVLIFTLMSYFLLAFSNITSNVSNATVYPAYTLSRDIDQIEESRYPGYKALIKSMQASHSNYTFLVYYTGLDWSEVLTTEYQGHGFSPTNLVQVGSNYNGMWICPLCGEKAYDNGSWCCASLEALAYMMDPRNSINDSDIFQFKDLEGSDVTYSDIARVVSGYGSYLNNPEAIQAIVDASNQYNVNGYFLVSKIVNEHGKNGSTLSNGNGYNGNYVGCYNYFNIGSYGNGSATIINNGLSYAKNAGWTSIRASILGGASIVKDTYITKYSQNTLYYQKFNVSGKSSLASHQYQQNIMAAQSQGTSLKAYYSNASSGSYTFIIPLYENMPTTTSARPNVSTKNTITYEEGTVQNVSSSLTVRASAGGTIIGALNNNESIKILKRASTQVNRYYWDLIVSNKDGTYGYAARSVEGDQCIVSNGSSGTSSGSTSSGGTTEETSTPNISTDTTTTIPTEDVVNLETDIVTKGDYIETIPNITYENIKEKYTNVKVVNSQGTEITSGNLGTGYTVTIDGKDYKIVKKGDTDGDGNITILDAVVLLNAIKGTRTLENEFKEAAAVNSENGEFNITDAVVLLNYIKGTSKITIK